jgi:tRNA U34 5-methylaminomethyl-2-thiouridine-forming methyltransferase MnmC
MRGDSFIIGDSDNMTDWTPEKTADGSYTFFSEEFQETFHSRQGAKAEAFYKFSRATNLTAAQDRDRLCLLDVCYGLGYNTGMALETIWQANPECHITLYGLELDATVPLGAVVPELLQDWTMPVQGVLQDLAREGRSQSPMLDATMLIGDARQTIQTLIAQNVQADSIFFDPFSPRRCPQLWSVEFFRQVVRCLAPTGKLATYSRSASVRSALCEVGLKIGTIPLAQEDWREYRPHDWSQGTIGAWDDGDLHPLSVMELEHLKTRAATAYRDPNLTDTTAMILARHREAQARSTAEATTQWRRRWGIQ